MPVFTSGGSAVGTGEINNGAIINEDINANAAIDQKKFASPVLVKATKSANQALSLAPALLTFDTEVTDVDNAFASSVYTSPRAQTVRVMVNVYITDTDSTPRHLILQIRVNGSVVRQIAASTSSAAGDPSGIAITDVITLANTNTLDIYLAGTDASHSAVGGAAFTCLTIESA